MTTSTIHRNTTAQNMNQSPAWMSAPVSEGRKGFIRTLLAEREVSQILRDDLFAQARAGMTTAQAISWIETLKIQPMKGGGQSAPVAMPSIDVVPEGRYAVATEDGAINRLAFYKVDRPTEGRWAGYVFVKLIVSENEQRMSRAAGAAIVAKIAEVGAAEASAAYGRESRKCGICGRNLTNDASRERGIGPDCAGKLGW